MKLHVCHIFLLLVAIGSCQDDGTQTTAGNNNFNSIMFTEVANNNVNKSYVLSGFSTIIPLAQLSLASVGDTHDELLRAIGLPDDEATKTGFKNVNEKLKATNGVELKIVNRIYVGQSLAVNDDFAAAAKESFDSDVQNIDFSVKEEALGQINSWVEDQTNNKISNFLDSSSVSENTEAVLVNALYFKGTWKKGFDPSSTIEVHFKTPDGEDHTIPMMIQESNFMYGESEELDARILEMPYEGDESALYILLPNEKDGIKMLEQNLKEYSRLEKALQNLAEEDVEAHIPKFTIETTTNLKNILPKIGVEKIFTPDEKSLNKFLQDKEDFFISDAILKTVIEISEEGSETKSACGFVGDVTPVQPPAATEFIADHPFVFVLRVNQNILFSGAFYS